MCSLTWVSDEVKERDAFRRLRLYYLPPSRGHPAKMYPPYLPTNMGEWVVHRVTILEAKAVRMKKQIAARLSQRESLCKEKVQPVLQGKKLGDFRSTVLAQFTIWRPDEIENPSRAQAPWPDSTECSHEGGERAKSGFGAFPPLPRVPGNPTVNWKQRNTITPYDFDKVGQPMFVNDTPLDVDEHMEKLIGNSLCAELNAYGAF
ncbi:hypothetical protein BGW36DRAFT_172549 [Talaromyces proteolyticus]|uniref:Uncharacterized protein n=1 Tax=Talaromyces proteolyticus TaxID=1131652 RepID=A0AAD4KPV3_9EURO|nr:uncharacterized protein BGW36DRAFT_172549 [Talaromyces proteolyticus]KAH8697687.1 hypothetical protein BGW36DRAFT_172549 [Talaromyces proteolyticus]